MGDWYTGILRFVYTEEKKVRLLHRLPNLCRYGEGDIT